VCDYVISGFMRGLLDWYHRIWLLVLFGVVKDSNDGLFSAVDVCLVVGFVFITYRWVLFFEGIYFGKQHA